MSPRFCWVIPTVFRNCLICNQSNGTNTSNNYIIFAINIVEYNFAVKDDFDPWNFFDLFLEEGGAPVGVAMRAGQQAGVVNGSV